MAPAAAGCMILAENLFIEHIRRKAAPVEPATEIRYEFALIVHRPRRVTLTAKTCAKSINVNDQWAHTGALGWRRCAAVPIRHRSPPQSRGQSPPRDDSRIIP